MAGRRWTDKTTSIYSRTFERVTIAVLATLAARGNETSVAITVGAIFIILVVVEEFGRTWIWEGKVWSLRDVVRTALERGALRDDERGGNRRDRRKRAKPKKG